MSRLDTEYAIQTLVMEGWWRVAKHIQPNHIGFLIHA